MRFTYVTPRETDKQKEHSKTSPEKCLPRERVHQVSNKSSSLEAFENSKEREKTQRSKLRNKQGDGESDGTAPPCWPPSTPWPTLRGHPPQPCQAPAGKAGVQGFSPAEPHLSWGSACFQRSQRQAHERGLGHRPPGRGREVWTPSELDYNPDSLFLLQFSLVF